MLTRDFFELHPDVANFINGAINPNEVRIKTATYYECCLYM